jgi:hypothetical protein
MNLSKLRICLYAWFPWRESFVMIPMMSMVFNVILAATLSQITSPDNPQLLSQGITMIGLVSNASISIVTLTFSLTVLSIQIAAQSYSPRLLDDFLKVRTKEEEPLFSLMVHLDNNRTPICQAVPHLILTLLSLNASLGSSEQDCYFCESRFICLLFCHDLLHSRRDV